VSDGWDETHMGLLPASTWVVDGIADLDHGKD
jgi:hypothetical protein